MNLYRLFERSIASHADAPAIIGGDGQMVTFRELDDAVARAVSLLARHGLTRGATVLLLQPMGIDLYVALLAIVRVGAAAMFLDPTAGRGHIDRCCARRTPDALAAGWKGQLLRLASPALRRVRVRLAFGRVPFSSASFEDARALTPTRASVDVPDDGAALVTFTSGSTGAPKAAVRTHGLLRAQYERLSEAIELEPGERDLTTLPIFVLANLAAGVTTILPNADLRRVGAVAPAPILAQIEALRPSRVVASPAFLHRIATRPLPSFRKVYTGGAPVFLDDLDAFAASFPSARVTNVYGSTEAEPIAHLDRAQLDEADRNAILHGAGICVGQPIDRIDLRIVPDTFGQPIEPSSSEAFARRALPPRAIGEIVVSGAHVLPGYLDGVGDDETKFRVGEAIWHRTGDAGYLDDRGRLWLVGRASARIEDALGTTYPLAVECAARARLRRRVAFVLHRGERTLVVEGHGPIDEAALGREVTWARIDRVRRLGAIPLDARHSAKIDYPRLRRAL